MLITIAAFGESVSALAARPAAAAYHRNMHRFRFHSYLFFALALGAVAAGCARTNTGPQSSGKSQGGHKNAPRVALEIECDGAAWGEVVFELDEVRAPITAANFLRYVKDGYFHHTLIHRVLAGPGVRINILQGGGYTQLGGANKPGQRAPIKLESDNGLSNVRGTIAMARDAAPDTATSEFFVNIQDNTKLDYVGPEKRGYCVFGKVVKGIEVIDRIAGIATVTNPDPQLKGERSLPVSPPMVVRARQVQ